MEQEHCLKIGYYFTEYDDDIIKNQKGFYHFTLYSGNNIF